MLNLSRGQCHGSRGRPQAAECPSVCVQSPAQPLCLPSQPPPCLSPGLGRAALHGLRALQVSYSGRRNALCHPSLSPFPEERVRPGALPIGLGHVFIWGLVLWVCVRKCRNELPLVVTGLCGTAVEVQACVSGVGRPEGVCAIVRLHARHPPACPAVLPGGPSLPSQGLVYRGGALVAGPAAHLPVCPGIAPLSPRSL